MCASLASRCLLGYFMLASCLLLCIFDLLTFECGGYLLAWLDVFAACNVRMCLFIRPGPLARVLPFIAPTSALDFL